jgi:hypothetical protein
LSLAIAIEANAAPLSIVFTRLLSKLLFGVGATDPATFVGHFPLADLRRIAPSYIRAQRAARVDPMVSLRYEWEHFVGCRFLHPRS